jgi:hypothetical protein
MRLSWMWWKSSNTRMWGPGQASISRTREATRASGGGKGVVQAAQRGDEAGEKATGLVVVLIEGKPAEGLPLLFEPLNNKGAFAVPCGGGDEGQWAEKGGNGRYARQ